MIAYCFIAPCSASLVTTSIVFSRDILIDPIPALRGSLMEATEQDLAVFTAPRWPALQRGTPYAATCLRREWYSADSHWGKSWERSRADTARTWADRLG